MKSASYVLGNIIPEKPPKTSIPLPALPLEQVLPHYDAVGRLLLLQGCQRIQPGRPTGR